MRIVLLSLVFFFGLISSSWAQTRSLADLANYRGADREEMLQAGAKKEAKLVWYTSLTAHRDIANVFEAKYPGIKVETYRAGSTDLTRRLLSEAQSRRSIADLIETTPPTLMVMRDNKLLTPYFSPHLAAYPEESKEEADKTRVLWTTDRESIIGLGYNTNLMRAADVPKTFADLAKPQHKGKIGVSGDSTGVRFIGALIRAKRGRVRQAASSSGYENAHDFRRRHTRTDGRRRDAHVDFDFPQSCARCAAQGSAHGMGAHGLKSYKRGRCCTSGWQ